MSDQVVQPAAEVTPGLTQLQRIVNIFTAPSKTFTDIKRGHKSWWLPFVIYCGLRSRSYGPPSTPRSPGRRSTKTSRNSSRNSQSA